MTEMKYSTDKKDYITRTKKFYGTEKEIIMDTRSPVTVLPLDKNTK